MITSDGAAEIIAAEFPYSTAPDYRAAGWTPIRLEAATKWPPPDNCTGQYPDPSPEMIEEWSEKPDGNIALRLPETVIGIDVDHYGDKTGGDTLAALEAELGQLPETVISSSRDDEVSGIKLFRVPAGLKFKGKAGPGIDVLSHAYRYAVVWPSVHDKTGQVYSWRGLAAGQQLPTTAELPELPAPWVAELQDDARGGVEVTDEAAEAILTEGEPCKYMSRQLASYRNRVEAGEGHHHAMITAAMAIARAGEQGHGGSIQAIDDLGDQFAADVDRPGMAEEFERGWTTAVEKVLAEPSEEPKRCCNLQRLKVSDPDEAFWTSRPSLERIDSLPRPDSCRRLVCSVACWRKWWPRRRLVSSCRQ
jgi:hypothetical protein